MGAMGQTSDFQALKKKSQIGASVTRAFALQLQEPFVHLLHAWDRAQHFQLVQP